MAVIISAMAGWPARISALGAAFGFFAAALGGAAQSESLADALMAAYRSSDLLEANRAILRGTDEGVAQAVANLRPTLSLVGSLNRDWRSEQGGNSALDQTTGSLQLTLEYLLWDGGSRISSVKAAEEAVLAGRQTLKSVEQDVLLNAVAAYLDVRRSIENLALEENNFRVISRELDAARGRFAVGQVTRTEVSMAEARLAAARSSLALRQGELEIAREEYRLSTGQYPGDLEPTPAPPAIPASLENAVEIGIKRHPSIIASRHAANAAEMAFRAADTILSPRISLGGSVGTRNTFESMGGSVNSAGVSLTAVIPLYDGGGGFAGIRNLRAGVDRAKADLQRSAKVVRQNIASAWARLKIAESSIEARAEQIEASELAFRGVREEALLGVRSVLDVLDAEQTRLAAGTDLAGAVRDRELAVYALLASIGLLTAEHLGLEVELYDPSENYRAVKSAPFATEVIKRLGVGSN
ncbi:MAG: TolC family outer membrane protein [Albidovulum sp.]|nr:TolC family outer membrane protein [Albidovulum sp.]